MAPVSVVTRFVALPSQVEGLYGSIWHGRAVLAQSHDLRWETDPWSVLSLGLRSDLILTGEGTHLTATLRGGLTGIEALDVNGRAGPGLLALADGMPEFTCTARGVVDIARLAAGRDRFAADGTVVIAAGSCTEPQGRVTPVPSMLLTLATRGDDAVAQLSSENVPFATVEVQGVRRLVMQIEPEGARNVPGLPTGGAIRLEYPF